VRFLNKLKRQEVVKPVSDAVPSKQETLLAEIRDLLKYQSDNDLNADK
jgi:large-conductance mechanosensitive channel